MGADIHVVIETRFGDQWVGVWTDEVVNSVAMAIGGPRRYERPDLVEKDYRFFGMLAGVRCGDFDDAFETGHAFRNVPEDASELTKAIIATHEGQYGYHNYGWCDLNTLCEIKIRARTHVWSDSDPEEIEASEALQAKLEGVSPVDSVVQICGRHKDRDFRAVFWFDS